MPTVTSIDDSSITVAGKKTYLVDSTAQITVDGKTAELSAVKVGMRVLVTGRVIERGQNTKESAFRATRIVARSQ